MEKRYIILLILTLLGTILLYQKYTEKFQDEKPKVVNNYNKYNGIKKNKDISLMVCYAPWCGPSKRFIGLIDAIIPERIFNIAAPMVSEKGAVKYYAGPYTNKRNGELVADWKILKGAFGDVYDIKELDFEDPGTFVNTKEDIKRLAGPLALDGYPTIYIVYKGKYNKFIPTNTSPRDAGSIVKWMDYILNTGTANQAKLANYLQNNGFSRIAPKPKQYDQEFRNPKTNY